MKKYNLKPSEKLLKKLRSGFIKKENYIAAVTSIPRPSHDLFPLVKYENKEGILLVKRKIEPAKGLIWCLGGKHDRGYLIRDSLINLIKNESHLEIYDIVCILTGEPEDIFWDKDPFGHGKGVHDSCTPYFAKTKGELQLDENHSTPLIVTRPIFEEIKDDLHWYVKKYTEKALEIAFNK